MAIKLDSINMEALHASLLASLEVSAQKMSDEQLRQALADGCGGALQPFVKDIGQLKT